MDDETLPARSEGLTLEEIAAHAEYELGDITTGARQIIIQRSGETEVIVRVYPAGGEDFETCIIPVA